MRNKNFAAFILSHGRANTCYTYDALIKSGYTGKIYILIDNEDKTAQQYYDKFGDKVIVFDKKKASESIDSSDNFNDRRAILYARNENFKIAKELEIKYFIQLDDDYKDFRYMFNSKLEYTRVIIRNLDNIFDAMLDFYKSVPNCYGLSMAQGGDFIGGIENSKLDNISLYRKCMNTWILSTERQFDFVGKMNEDCTAYVLYGNQGKLFFTLIQCYIIQAETQKLGGGMTEFYLDNGTYLKTFYTIMRMPSCIKINLMGTTHKRLHHNISWNNAVPKIIDEKHKKI